VLTVIPGAAGGQYRISLPFGCSFFLIEDVETEVLRAVTTNRWIRLQPNCGAFGNSKNKYCKPVNAPHKIRQMHGRRRVQFDPPQTLGPMHVLVTTDTISGVWTYARELVSGLVSRGLRVTLVSLGEVSPT